MQPNAELLKYIQEQTGQGWSIDQIVPELYSFGWPEDEIRAALAWFNAQGSQTEGEESVLPDLAQQPNSTPQMEQPLQTDQQQYIEQPSIDAPQPQPNLTTPLDTNQYPVPESQTYPEQRAMQPPVQTPPLDPMLQPPLQAQETTPAQYPPQQLAAYPAETDAMVQPAQPLQYPQTPNPVAQQAGYPPLQPPILPEQTPQISQAPLAPLVVTATQPAQPAVPMVTPQPQQTQQALAPMPAPVVVTPTVPVAPAQQNTPYQQANPGELPNPAPQTAAPQNTPAPLPVLSANSRSTPFFKHYKRLASLVFITAAVTISSLLLWSLMHESPQTTLKKTVQKSLLTSTFERDYTNVSAGDGLQIHAKIKSNFTDTTQPKSTGTIDATLEFGPDSTVEATYDMVAIEDTVWLRVSDSKVDLSDATRQTYQKLSQGGTVDDTINSLVGIGVKNQWTEYSYNPSFVSSYGLTYNVVRYAFALNSPLAEFPILNANQHNNTAVSLVLNSGMITVDYKSVSNDSIDGKKYKLFKATYSSKDFAQTSKNLAELLDLSQRHRDAITEKDIAVEDGELKLWVDQKTHLPHKLDVPRDGVTIIYSNFGRGVDVKSPL